MKVRREYSVAIFSFFRNCFPNCRGKIIIWPKKKKKKNILAHLESGH
jgi:hypothetical protein